MCSTRIKYSYCKSSVCGFGASNRTKTKSVGTLWPLVLDTGPQWDLGLQQVGQEWCVSSKPEGTGVGELFLVLLEHGFVLKQRCEGPHMEQSPRTSRAAGRAFTEGAGASSCPRVGPVPVL